MRYRILLTLHPVDGALVRALALAERRGFSISTLSTHVEGGARQVSLEVHSPDRSIENLCRQLAKLRDVSAVRTAPDDNEVAQ